MGATTFEVGITFIVGTNFSVDTSFEIGSIFIVSITFKVGTHFEVGTCKVQCEKCNVKSTMCIVQCT